MVIFIPFVIFLFALLVRTMLMGGVVYVGWNIGVRMFLLPSKNYKPLTWWQAVGLGLLSSFVFGSGSS